MNSYERLEELEKQLTLLEEMADKLQARMITDVRNITVKQSAMKNINISIEKINKEKKKIEECMKAVW